MAVYITLFSATLSELEERFPNVGDPLQSPRSVTRVNPFTKQLIQVEVLEPEFGPPRHRRSLFSEDGAAEVAPVEPPTDDYGRYLGSMVPARLRSVPHIGTKNVIFEEAEYLLGLGEPHPEKYVRCLEGEGSVKVASAALVEVLRANGPDELLRRFPEAWHELPLEWLRSLLIAPAKEQRYLCSWFVT
jgi:hypothetical protein